MFPGANVTKIKEEEKLSRIHLRSLHDFFFFQLGEQMQTHGAAEK